GSHGHEHAITPLANSPDIRIDVVLELDGSDHRVERAALDGLDNSLAILRFRLLNRLRKNLQPRICRGTCPEIRALPCGRLVAFHIILDLRIVGIDAANADDAFGRLAEPSSKGRERRADAHIECTDLKTLDLCLLGERERLAR